MNQKQLDLQRHSLAHLLAAAVLSLWPKARFGVGPVIENGFYYDVEIPDCQLTETDLLKIEKRMKKLKEQKLEFQRREMSVDEAVALFKKLGQTYKVELLNDLKTKGTTRLDTAEAEILSEGKSKISVYQTGEFIDLCRGPHLKNTKELTAAFKLDRLAGAYWRGNEENPMLTRLYGLAFTSQPELDEYLAMMEEAKKRDHRKLGRDLDLFVFSETVGKGLPLWTEKGTIIRRELENFIIEEETKRGYKHVMTPDMARLALYEKSGHYPYYKESMYPPMEIDEDKFMLRPMACPHHFELYLSRPRSYRELPLRIAELAKLYRYEKSGELTGLMRVRNFCLADAHIICADEKQAKEEINGVLNLIEHIADIFGLTAGKNYSYRLSLGDRKNEKKYFKDDKAWDAGEKILKEVLKERKTKFVEAPDEAAFYGPKIDFQMKNVMNKEDTAFTVQYDFVMPKRFNLNYINQKGNEQETIVIHRSSIGAIERSIAFLIEHYAGAFPLWLCPVQVKIVSVGADHKKYCEELSNKLAEAGIRVETDLSNETVGHKIRKAVNEKVPYMLVIGDKELKSDKLMVRVRGQEKLLEIPADKFIDKAKELIKEKSLEL
ncbi:MAG TPA: threonine--tRNA ligase [Patescibacteria group bacterium]|nr:threonine--tRNA ligase [Patescibacteria group bacterium]